MGNRVNGDVGVINNGPYICSIPVQYVYRGIYMVINDPIVRRLQMLKMIIAAGATVVIGGFVVLYAINHFWHPIEAQTLSNYNAVLSFLMFFLLIMFFVSIMSMRTFKNVVQQYTTALQGGVPGRIAAEQPRIFYDTAPLPITLMVRASQLYYIFFFVICCLAFFYMIFVSTVFPSIHFKSNSPLLNVLVGLLILTVIGGLWFFCSASYTAEYRDN